MQAILQFTLFIVPENTQTRHKTTEFFHRFPVLASQLLFHDPQMMQFPGRD